MHIAFNFLWCFTHRCFHNSSNLQSHIPSELDFLLRIKTTADIAPAKKTSTRTRTSKRRLLQWLRNRYFMCTELLTPSTSWNWSSAAGLLRFLCENMVSAMQRNCLCQCSGGCYKWQEGKEISLGVYESYSVQHSLTNFLSLAFKCNIYQNFRERKQLSLKRVQITPAICDA